MNASARDGMEGGGIRGCATGDASKRFGEYRVLGLPKSSLVCFGNY